MRRRPPIIFNGLQPKAEPPTHAGGRLLSPAGAIRAGPFSHHQHDDKGDTMTTTTKNPYPRRQGFALRVANAKRALRRLGRDCFADIYTRGFDNCFEMFDGDAVVWALMHEAVNGDDVLERGIRNMGKDVVAALACCLRTARRLRAGE